MNVLFTLPLITDSLNPCRISWRVNMSTIVPYPMNNGVTCCPLWRLNIIGKVMWPISRGLHPLRQLWLIMSETTPQGFHVRRGQGLVSYHPAKIRARILPRIMGLRATAYYARRKKYLSASGNCVAPRIALEKL